MASNQQQQHVMSSKWHSGFFHLRSQGMAPLFCSFDRLARPLQWARSDAPPIERRLSAAQYQDFVQYWNPSSRNKCISRLKPCSHRRLANTKLPLSGDPCRTSSPSRSQYQMLKANNRHYRYLLNEDSRMDARFRLQMSIRAFGKIRMAAAVKLPTLTPPMPHNAIHQYLLLHVCN